MRLNTLSNTVLFQHFFPELVALKDCPQHEEHHPEGSVWNHTMMVVDIGASIIHDALDEDYPEVTELLSDNFAKQVTPLPFMLSCLFHDIGKVPTKMVDEKGVHSYGHDVIGAEMIEPIVTRIFDDTALDKTTIKQVAWLTQRHMRMHNLLKLKDRKIKNLMIEPFDLSDVSRAQDFDFSTLIALNIADTLGRDLPKSRLLQKLDLEDKVKKIAELSHGTFGRIVPFFDMSTIKTLTKRHSPKSQSISVQDLYRKAFDLQLQGRTKGQIERTLIKNIKMIGAK